MHLRFPKNSFRQRNDVNGINPIPRFDSYENKPRGFICKGQIYLNGEFPNNFTPIYLAAHFLFEWTKLNYQPLYYKLIELIHGNSLIEYKKNESFYLEEVNKRGLREGMRPYEEYFKQEALAEAVARCGSQFIIEAKKVEAIKWEKKLYQSLAKEKGMKGFRIDEIDTITLDELVRRISIDILKGEGALYYKENILIYTFKNYYKIISSLIIKFYSKFKSSDYKSQKFFSSLHDDIFPGGLDEKKYIGKLIQIICNNRLRFDEAIKLYVSAKSRFIVYKNTGPDIDGDYMIASIIHDTHNKIGKDEGKEILKLIFFGEKYTLKNSELEGVINTLFGFINNGEIGNRLKNSKGDFGLVPSNPIPVKGLISANKYLERLRNMDGNAITWKRMQQFNYEEFAFPMDVYEIYDKNNIHIQNIFIFPYHGKTSTELPKGFVSIE